MTSVPLLYHPDAPDHILPATTPYDAAQLYRQGYKKVSSKRVARRLLRQRTLMGLDQHAMVDWYRRKNVYLSTFSYGKLEQGLSSSAFTVQLITELAAAMSLTVGELISPSYRTPQSRLTVTAQRQISKPGLYSVAGHSATRSFAGLVYAQTAASAEEAFAKRATRGKSVVLTITSIKRVSHSTYVASFTEQELTCSTSSAAEPSTPTTQSLSATSAAGGSKR